MTSRADKTTRNLLVIGFTTDEPTANKISVSHPCKTSFKFYPSYLEIHSLAFCFVLKKKNNKKTYS